jgi:hypothetical protein
MRALGRLLDHRPIERHEPADDHPLRGHRQELRVGQLDQVVLARFEPGGHVLGDPPGVLVGGLVGKPLEVGVDVPAPEAEVRRGLLAHGDESGLAALAPLALHRPLGGPDHRAVVGPAQAPVGGHDHVGHGVHLVALGQQRRVTGGAGRGQVAQDLGDLLAVGPGGGHALLGLGDAAGGDELHGLGDLHGRLHRADPPAQRPFLTAGHG